MDRINKPVSLTLTWQVSPSATYYQYCYSTTSSCTNWTKVTTNSVSLSGLTHNKTYYWQVRAFNGPSYNTLANDGTLWSFSTIPAVPAAFNKSAPANAATNQSLTPTLSWAASSGAVSYQYCYDTISNSTCEGTWKDVGTAISAVLPALDYSTKYYWQVRAINPGGTVEANTGAWWNFTTLPQAPAGFSKISPADSTDGTSLKPSLSWESSSRATSYQYCYDTSENDTCDGTWTTTTASSVTLSSSLAAGTTYYWQVRAANLTGTTDANGGTWWSFTTLPLPDAFTKVGPVTGSLDQPLALSLSWNSSIGAITYEYCYDTTNDNTCSSWTSTSGTSANLSGLARHTTYYWQVRAVNPSGNTIADSNLWWSFTTIPNAPAAFNKSAPANAATNQSIGLGLSWAASSGAAAYEYCLDDTINNTTCESGWVSTGTGRSVYPPGLAYSTKYYWQVRATNYGRHHQRQYRHLVEFHHPGSPA